MNNQLNARIKQFLSRATAARKSKDYEKCKHFCDAILKLQRNNYDALLTVSQAATENRQFADAVDYGYRLIQAYPDHPNGAIISSVGLMNMGRNEEAVMVLEKQLRVNEKERALLFNLHTAYSSLGDSHKAIQIALQAIEKFPTDSDAFNNLGASLSTVGRNTDAIIAFETSLDLNSNNYTARINLINCKSRVGGKDQWVVDEVQKIESSKTPLISKRSLIGARHNAAFSFFRLGQPEKGWEYLEEGFSPELDNNRGRHPRRNFTAPRWKGEPLKGKRLLVWREQGLGDEIMFGTMLHELTQIDGQVVLECSERLISIFQRAFPNFEVRSELYRSVYPFDSPTEDFDCQIPFGSLGGIYRPTVESFSRGNAYLTPNLELTEKYKSRLQALAPGKKWIGLCWRSGLISPTRGASYTLLEDWDALLQRDDIAVVNLQYGKCEEEILAAEQRTGAQIIRWEDTNLQNDLEAVLAIISNMSAVCSVGTVVAQMAGAAGITTKLVCNKPEWTSFGTEQFLFTDSIKLMLNKQATDIRESVKMCISQV